MTNLAGVKESVGVTCNSEGLTFVAVKVAVSVCDVVLAFASVGEPHTECPFACRSSSHAPKGGRHGGYVAGLRRRNLHILT